MKRGIKPLAQIGFMPEALSIKPEPYKHNWEPGNKYSNIFTGWVYPPKDYKKWAALIYSWVKHEIERYGKKEVESWYWELWNEPNIGYWGGTVQEYCKLYDYTADAVRRALPAAIMGGPDVTGPAGNGAASFLRTFIKHITVDTNYVTGKIGSPLDFISFHAKGSPKFVDGHVRMGISNQLKDIAAGFSIITSNPATKNLPIIIGESDPEGCAACGMATNPENSYRNGTMYSSYTAASFARVYQLSDQYHANLLAAVSWAFEFEDQPWFYGFRDLATNGVDKPVLNIFRMFSKMGGKRVAVNSGNMYPLQTVMDSGVRAATEDIGALASSDNRRAAIMLWNYYDDDLVKNAKNVVLTVKGIPAKNITITQYRIDKEHSNSYELWKKMGSPQQPTTEQVAQLEKAGQLEQMGQVSKAAVTHGLWNASIEMPLQAVVLVKVEW
jgi:xylan 1,4-beta-xylosidase